jgi:hypothetical protein
MAKLKIAAHQVLLVVVSPHQTRKLMMMKPAQSRPGKHAKYKRKKRRSLNEDFIIQVSQSAFVMMRML